VRYRVLLLAAVASISNRPVCPEAGVAARSRAHHAPRLAARGAWGLRRIWARDRPTTAKDQSDRGKPLIVWATSRHQRSLSTHRRANNTAPPWLCFLGAATASWPSTWKAPKCASAQLPASRACCSSTAFRFRPLSQSDAASRRLSARGYRALSRFGVAYRPAPHRRPGLFRGSPPSPALSTHCDQTLYDSDDAPIR